GPPQTLRTRSPRGGAAQPPEHHGRPRHRLDRGQRGRTPLHRLRAARGRHPPHQTRPGPIPPRKAIQYATQVARGLAAAHAKGIAHRDLKPENLMILSGDHVKILDFGLAKLLRPEAAGDGAKDDTGPIAGALTMTGEIFGTPSYMSPEQVRDQPSDHRTDIFALGAILYELLTGRRPFGR